MFKRFLTQAEAIAIDSELFGTYKFSVDQLMELAGLSCACAIAKCYPHEKQKKILVCCGPGNNGGDGLVCARHLKLFKYDPIVFYQPNNNKANDANRLYTNLRVQCETFGIPVVQDLSQCQLSLVTLIVDALFGFSFKPPVRAEFTSIMSFLTATDVPIVSIDIPSGWHVESGPHMMTDRLKPEMLVSLTAPKMCAKFFNGKFHYLGGRFLPNALIDKYELHSLPLYTGTELVVKLLNQNCK